MGLLGRRGSRGGSARLVLTCRGPKCLQLLPEDQSLLLRLCAQLLLLVQQLGHVDEPRRDLAAHLLQCGLRLVHVLRLEAVVVLLDPIEKVIVRIREHGKHGLEVLDAIGGLARTLAGLGLRLVLRFAQLVAHGTHRVRAAERLGRGLGHGRGLGGLSLGLCRPGLEGLAARALAEFLLGIFLVGNGPVVLRRAGDAVDVVSLARGA